MFVGLFGADQKLLGNRGTSFGLGFNLKLALAFASASKRSNLHASEDIPHPFLLPIKVLLPAAGHLGPSYEQRPSFNGSRFSPH